MTTALSQNTETLGEIKSWLALRTGTRWRLSDEELDRRLGVVAREYQLATAEDVWRAVQQGNSRVGDSLITRLTNHETSFFRDAKQFLAFRDVMLPELEQTVTGRPLQIWSAACSTGQEPLSIAMLVRSYQEQHRKVDFRIRATDIAAGCIERAQRGIYSQLEVSRGLPAKLLVKYFDQYGADWRAERSLLECIDYRVTDITRGGSSGIFDVIFLRNALIYMEDDARVRVLCSIRRQLAPHGFLLLGTGESPRVDSSHWQLCSYQGAVYYRLKEPIP